MTAAAILRNLAAGKPCSFAHTTFAAPIDVLADLELVRVTRDSRGRPITATITDAGRAALRRDAR